MFEPQRTFMELAIEEARKAASDEYRIGAVIVKGEEVVAKSPARAKADIDPTQHAEIAAIRLACKSIGARHIPGCILYTTHEPCAMCAAAAVWAKLDGIVYGATNDDMREKGWRLIDLDPSKILDNAISPKLFLMRGFMREECKQL